jgi:hypothetical protein
MNRCRHDNGIVTLNPYEATTGKVQEQSEATLVVEWVEPS